VPGLGSHRLRIQGRIVVADRILIVERDPTDETVWRYGIADETGELAAGAYRLRHATDTGWVPVGEENAHPVADRNPPHPPGRRADPDRLRSHHPPRR
jgi:hypothetical protein